MWQGRTCKKGEPDACMVINWAEVLECPCLTGQAACECMAQICGCGARGGASIKVQKVHLGSP